MIFKFIRSLDLTNSPSKNTKIIRKLIGKKNEGSGRIVYSINDNWVIKVAKNKGGLSQNRKEAEVWKYASNIERKYICCIRWFHPNYLWVVQKRIEKKIKRGNKKANRIGNELYYKCEYVFVNFKVHRADCNQIGYIKGKPKFYDYGY